MLLQTILLWYMWSKDGEKVRLIDADALKKAILEHKYDYIEDNFFLTKLFEIIDKTPELGYEDGILSVKNATRRPIELEDAYNNGWSDGFSEGENERPQGEWVRKEDVIHSIAKQYSEHNELVPIWLSIGDMKGGAE